MKPNKPQLPRSVALVLLLLCAVVSRGIGSPRNVSVDEAIDSLLSTHNFEEVVISPDGKKVAWSETLLGSDKMPSGNTAIYVSDVPATEVPRRITASTGPG